MIMSHMVVKQIELCVFTDYIPLISKARNVVRH